jgi:hypothetical protein
MRLLSTDLAGLFEADELSKYFSKTEMAKLGVSA